MTQGQGWWAAKAVNHDGTIVAGETGTVPSHVFRWTAHSGITDLGTVPDAESVQVYDMNADGTIIVGESFDHTDDGAIRTAFRYAGGYFRPIPSEHAETGATGVSADGSTVIGWYQNAEDIKPEQEDWDYHAFRWTASGGMVEISVPSSTSNYAYAVNADGSVVVGGTDAPGGGWIWTEHSGATLLSDMLLEFGVELPEDRYILPRSVSGDGRIVVGISGLPDGTGLKGWVLRL